MSSPIPNPVSTRTQTVRDVRNILFFVFFAITIGAASGLFTDTHEARNTIAQKSQIAGAATSQTSDIPEIFKNTQKQTFSTNNNITHFLGLYKRSDPRNGQPYYERQVIKFDTTLRYFPTLNEYYYGSGCGIGVPCSTERGGYMGDIVNEIKREDIAPAVNSDVSILDTPRVPSLDVKISSQTSQSDVRLERNSRSPSYPARPAIGIIPDVSSVNPDAISLQHPQSTAQGKGSSSSTLDYRKYTSGGYVPQTNSIPGIKGMYGNYGKGYVIAPINNKEELIYHPDSGKYYVTETDVMATSSIREVTGQELNNIKKVINENKGIYPTNEQYGRYTGTHQSAKRVTSTKDTLLQNAYKKSNRCSTTYVTQDSMGIPRTKDCYGAPSDEAYFAITTLAKCVAQNTRTARTPDAIARVYKNAVPTLTAGICQGQKPQVVETIPRRSILLQRNPNVIYPISVSNIPSACTAQYNKVVWLMGGVSNNPTFSKNQKSASRNDARTCAYKGAVVCLQSNPNDPESIVCKAKSKIAIEKTLAPDNIITAPISSVTPRARPSQPTLVSDTSTTCKGFMCFIDSLLKDKGIKKSITNAMKRLITGENAQGCPKGYVTAGVTTTGTTTRATCKPAPVIPQPQCAIATNKTNISSGKSVLMRWKTRNAKTVTIDGISGAVSSNGEKTLTPKVTTTYTLIAKNGSKTKTCSTKVVVDGQQTGSTGAYPPQVSCSPRAVLPGAQAKVSWTCSSQADRSSSNSITTGGTTSGSALVTPNATQDYAVKCFAGDKEIGSNTCSVTVGEPQFDIIAYPTQVKKGGRARISWASLFMKSCRVQGPRGFNYSYTEGSVVTKPFDIRSIKTPADAIYTLTCQSQFGTQVVRDVSVGFTQ